MTNKTTISSKAVSDHEVRAKARIIIANVGLKAIGGIQNIFPADFYMDARGLPDAVTGLPIGETLEQFVEKRTHLPRYVDTLLEAIHAIPRRRYQLGDKWHKQPVTVITFCAYGQHRSKALKNLLARELRELGYHVTVI
jgi:RNase adaptor protein for sRNA GlmZ degradation